MIHPVSKHPKLLAGERWRFQQGAMERPRRPYTADVESTQGVLGAQQRNLAGRPPHNQLRDEGVVVWRDRRTRAHGGVHADTWARGRLEANDGSWARCK